MEIAAYTKTHIKIILKHKSELHRTVFKCKLQMTLQFKQTLYADMPA